MIALRCQRCGDVFAIDAEDQERFLDARARGPLMLIHRCEHDGSAGVLEELWPASGEVAPSTGILH